MSVFRQAIAPVLAAYLAFLAMLVSYARTRKSVAATAPLERSTRSIGATMTGGFVCFLVIVMVFYPVLGNERPAIIGQALAQGLVLIFAIVIPGFLLLSALWAAVVRRRRTTGNGM